MYKRNLGYWLSWLFLITLVGAELGCVVLFLKERL